MLQTMQQWKATNICETHRSSKAGGFRACASSLVYREAYVTCRSLNSILSYPVLYSIILIYRPMPRRFGNFFHIRPSHRLVSYRARM